MRKFTLPLVLLCAASLSSVGAAQQLSHTLDKVELSQAPIEVALREIFQDKASFILSPEVKGEITASFNRVNAEKALSAVLRSAKATFRIEDGIYYIEPRGEIALPFSTPLTMEFKDMEVRTAIKNVMKASRATYTIAPDVQGMVSLSLKGEGFAEALDKILEQVGATYSMEGGVVNIRAKDRSHIGAGNDTRVSLDVTSADLSSALRLMLMGKPISMVIDSEVDGKVTAKFDSIRLEDALEKLLKQVGATYRTDGGIYQIVPLKK